MPAWGAVAMTLSVASLPGPDAQVHLIPGRSASALSMRTALSPDARSRMSCEPAPVIDWVRRNALCIRGNHDHAVAQNVVTNGATGFKYFAIT